MHTLSVYCAGLGTGQRGRALHTARTMTQHNSYPRVLAALQGVNDALSKHSGLQDLDLVSVLRAAGTDKIPSDIATPVRNHGRLLL